MEQGFDADGGGVYQGRGSLKRAIRAVKDTRVNGDAVLVQAKHSR